MGDVSVTNELSSRPERSVVEGPAVRSTSIQIDRKSRLFIRSEAEGSLAFTTKVRGKNKFVIPTGAYPDFLPHSTGNGRVCVFPQRKAHEVCRSDQPRQEIRGSVVETCCFSTSNQLDRKHRLLTGSAAEGSAVPRTHSWKCSVVIPFQRAGGYLRARGGNVALERGAPASPARRGAAWINRILSAAKPSCWIRW
jgi:hypothetical protein